MANIFASVFDDIVADLLIGSTPTNDTVLLSAARISHGLRNEMSQIEDTASERPEHVPTLSCRSGAKALLPEPPWVQCMALRSLLRPG